MAVNSNMINDRDTYQIAYARELGREEGIKQGLEQGLEQEMEQELEQELEQGKVAEREAIALRMVGANTPIEFIVSCTGLDKAAVEALARKTK